MENTNQLQAKIKTQSKPCSQTRIAGGRACTVVDDFSIDFICEVDSQTVLIACTFRVDDSCTNVITGILICRTQPRATRRSDSGGPSTPTETVPCTTDHSVEGTCKAKERTKEKAEDKKEDKT